jgi:hypothetical protein
MTHPRSNYILQQDMNRRVPFDRNAYRSPHYVPFERRIPPQNNVNDKENSVVANIPETTRLIQRLQEMQQQQQQQQEVIVKLQSRLTANENELKRPAEQALEALQANQSVEPTIRRSSGHTHFTVSIDPHLTHPGDTTGDTQPPLNKKIKIDRRRDGDQKSHLRK